MTQVVETLNKLKGVLLLDSLGTIYLLKDYDYRDREAGWYKTAGGFFTLWAPKKEEKVVSYVAGLTFSHLKPNEKYTYEEQSTLIKKVNEIVEDRNRYLRLQRSLKAIGAVITTKKMK